MILALIPARGGSKSIKNKNIIPLAGKPLIAYTIKTALSCKEIDKVVVSTDSPKIAKVARKYGAQVPFLRPKKLAQDKTPMYPVAQNAISWLENKGEKIDTLILLQPTSPFRRTKDIKKSLELLKKPQTEAVVGICEAEHNPYQTMTTIKNNYLIFPLFKIKKSVYYRQATPKVYRINGSLYTIKKDVIMKKNNFIPQKTRPLIIPPEFSIDIDNKIDLLFAEFLAKKLGITLP